MVLRDMMKSAKRRRAETRTNLEKKTRILIKVVGELSNLKSSSEVKLWQQHSKSIK